MANVHKKTQCFITKKHEKAHCFFCSTVIALFSMTTLYGGVFNPDNQGRPNYNNQNVQQSHYEARTKGQWNQTYSAQEVLMSCQAE